MNAIQEAQAEGYRVPRDYQELSQATRELDGKEVEFSICDECEEQWRIYVPLVKIENGVRLGYRYFAKCLNCGAVVEF